jgi:hypothetical protein
MSRSQITGFLLSALIVSMMAQSSLPGDNKYNTELLDQNYIGTYNTLSANVT